MGVGGSAGVVGDILPAPTASSPHRAGLKNSVFPQVADIGE